MDTKATGSWFAGLLFSFSFFFTSQKYLVKAINIFENMLAFSNHVNMFSEEIARTGEQLGNTPQAFSHLALISAAFNLDRVSGGSGGM